MQDAPSVQGRQPRRVIFADVLNIVSCIAVVALHSSLDAFTIEKTVQWRNAAIFQSVFIFAVPIFFMLSGMNLIKYRRRYTTATFFHKRFLKIGKAFIGGSFVCYLIFVLFPSSFYGADAFHKSAGVIDFITRILTNSVNDTYWFFYVLIYLYLLIPLLSLASENKKLLQYLLTLSAFASIAIPLLERFHVPHEWFAQSFNWPFFATIGLFYMLLGYYLHEFLQPSRWLAVISGLSCIISITLTIILTLKTNGYFGVQTSDIYNSYYAGISSPFCALSASSLFVFVMCLEPCFQGRGELFKKVVGRISKTSLGVYLFHIILIDWLGNPSLPQSHILKTIIVYLLTAAAVFAGKEIIHIGKRFILKTGQRRFQR